MFHLVVCGRALKDLAAAALTGYSGAQWVVGLHERGQSGADERGDLRRPQEPLVARPAVLLDGLLHQLERRRDLADEVVVVVVVDGRGCAVEQERPQRVPAAPLGGGGGEVPEHRQVLGVEAEEVAAEHLVGEIP